MPNWWEQTSQFLHEITEQLVNFHDTKSNAIIYMWAEQGYWKTGCYKLITNVRSGYLMWELRTDIGRTL